MSGNDALTAQTRVDDAPEQAFDRFVDLASWWPKAYTWSGDTLVSVAMEPRAGGLMTETGPHGFRCDFGRVLTAERPRRLVLAWQIGAGREPQPDPGCASEVEVMFAPAAGGGTEVRLVHRHFARHGGDTAGYRGAMASDLGWPYLLRCFAGEAQPR